MTNKIVKKILETTVAIVACYNFSLVAQNSDEYSLFYSVSYFEPKTINPIYGSYYLEGVQANELMYSRLWTWKKDISETSDLVEGITQQSLKTMLVPPRGGSSLWSRKVKIRPDLKWPDGEPLTAGDIKFSFDVYRADKSGSVLKELLQIFREIRVIDNHTIEFFVAEQDKRSAKLVLPLVQILPEHKVVTNYLLRKSSYSHAPMGSGPFQFVPQEKREPADRGNSKIVYEKNNHYHRWGKNSNINYVKATIERVLVDIIRTLVTEDREENWSTIDLLPNIPNSRSAYESIRDQGTHLVLESYNSNSWYGIALNCERPLLNNRNIRMALTYAVDIERPMNDYYATVPKGGKKKLIAQRISGPFNILWGAGDHSLKPIEHNQDTAKVLLDNSGVFEKGGNRDFEGEPVQLKLIYNSGKVDPGSPEEYVIKSLIGNLKTIGIKVVPENFPAKAFEDKLASGDYDMAFQKYEVGFGSNIAPLFTEGDKQNISRFTDPMLTNYLENFNSTKGKQKRQYGKQIHKIVYKETPYIFLYRLDKIMAYRKELETKDNIVPKYFFTHIGEWYFKDYK